MASHTASVRERNYNAERKVAAALLDRYTRAKTTLEALEPELRQQRQILEDVRTRFVKDADGPHVDPEPLDFSVLDGEPEETESRDVDHADDVDHDFHDTHYNQDYREPVFG
jgi:hypothetical protein